MERLTNPLSTKCSMDPWDWCGLDNVCTRDCFKPTPCKIPIMARRLAEYEDIGLKPDEIARLRAELEQVKNNRTSTVPCCECGGDAVEFTVPNDIWNAVMRPDEKETDREYLCLDCWYKALRNYINNLRAELDRERERAYAARKFIEWVDAEVGRYMPKEYTERYLEWRGKEDAK